MDIHNNIHQPTNFGKLRIKLSPEIRPDIFKEQGYIIKTLEQNKELQKFFKDRDGVAYLDNYFAYKKDYTKVTIMFNNKYSFKNLLNKILGTNRENAFDYHACYIVNDYYSSSSADRLSRIVKNITKSSLLRKVRPQFKESPIEKLISKVSSIFYGSPTVVQVRPTTPVGLRLAPEVAKI